MPVIDYESRPSIVLEMAISNDTAAPRLRSPTSAAFSRHAA